MDDQNGLNLLISSQTQYQVKKIKNFQMQDKKKKGNTQNKKLQIKHMKENQKYFIKIRDMSK